MYGDKPEKEHANSKAAEPSKIHLEVLKNPRNFARRKARIRLLWNTEAQRSAKISAGSIG